MLKLLVLLVLIAVAIWLLARVIIRRGILDPRDDGPPHGPDDDPDFLRTLDRRRRSGDD